MLLSVNKSNVFMTLIYEKVDFSFKHLFKYISHRIKYRKFIKDIKRGSPCFGVLWKMCDFIKLSEIAFFYNNSPDNPFGLYSSHNYEPGYNGMKIKTTELAMTIKLESSTQKVTIEINRLNGNHVSTTMTFINDNWTGSPDIYDEIILENIIRIINSKIIQLFEEMYEKR